MSYTYSFRTPWEHQSEDFTSESDCLDAIWDGYQRNEPDTPFMRSEITVFWWQVGLGYAYIDAGRLIADLWRDVESEDDEERHYAGCICADCTGAEITAKND